MRVSGGEAAQADLALLWGSVPVFPAAPETTQFFLTVHFVLALSVGEAELYCLLGYRLLQRTHRDTYALGIRGSAQINDRNGLSGQGGLGERILVLGESLAAAGRG